MTGKIQITGGQSHPLGATLTNTGINFALFSQHATRVTLCLFDAEGTETLNIDLPENTGHIWHGHIQGLTAGQHYGYRVHGPYRPDEGHRFNPHKLLLDPYARQVTGHPIWDDALMGYNVRAMHGDLTFDTKDSARFMPRCVVTDDTFDWGDDTRPNVPMSETIFYETHVKGITAARHDIPNAGTYEAAASDEMIAHYQRLGVTSIELLPIHAFLDERHLAPMGLRQYWGYMTTSFFAPEPRYARENPVTEFKTMVKRLHAAGLEVILDVVYNHTSEGNEKGPTLSFKGIDNVAYYRLPETRRRYINDSGTGNTLNLNHPMVMRMVMDSLRYWATEMRVDGFRFDLCSALGRTGTGFDRDAPFFQALRQDPVLSGVKLIAEPWDIGPGGYQLGSYQPPFSEWNDKYRDQVRGFWRGNPDMTRKLATRVSGSALRFDHSNRPATSSVNFLTAHDGFTLRDLVSYNHKHNEANGENNRDGHDHNQSDNMGVEGPSDDPAINAARAQRQRNMLATLFLSQGTPLLLAGDEIGNSQQGNNNAYAQDNEIGWIDWANADHDLCDFTAKLIRFRHDHPIVRQTLFLHSRSRLIDGVPDLYWRKADGSELTEADWNDSALQHLTAEMRSASGSPEYTRSHDKAVFIVFNVGPDLTVALPDTVNGQVWIRHIDTAAPRAKLEAVGEEIKVQQSSVVVLVLEQAAS